LPLLFSLPALPSWGTTASPEGAHAGGGSLMALSRKLTTTLRVPFSGFWRSIDSTHLTERAVRLSTKSTSFMIEHGRIRSDECRPPRKKRTKQKTMPCYILRPAQQGRSTVLRSQPPSPLSTSAMCAAAVAPARNSVGWDWRYLGFPTRRAVFVRLDRVLCGVAGCLSTLSLPKSSRRGAAARLVSAVFCE
jgi:hypothetical protein